MAGSPTGSRALLASLLMLAASCALPTDPASDLSDAIERSLEPYVEARSFSGTVLLVRGSDVLHHAGYGLADLESSTPNGRGTRFRIGSMTKSFTAAAILLLAERSELGLDDPVSRFVDDFPHGAVTIRQLLSHTSGLARYVFQPDYEARSRRRHSTRDLVDWIAEVPAVGQPGERYAYSNANYAVLAHVIEQVSGVAYGDFLADEILQPLGLGGTGDASAAEGPEGLAIGYHPSGLRRLEPARPFDYSTVTGAGSMYSTAEDLVKWLDSRERGQLLRQSTRQDMIEIVGTPFGYAWTVGANLGRQTVSLTGWDGVGFGARLVHYPAEGTTIVILANLNMSSIAGEVADEVAKLAFGEAREPLELLRRPQQEPAELRTHLAGSYRFGTDFYVPGSTIEIVERDGQLLIPAEPPFPEGGLLPLADGTFIHRQQWLRVAFERDPSGEVTGIQYGPFRATKARAPDGG